MNIVSLVVFLPLFGAIISALCIINSNHRKAEIFSTSLLTVAAILSVIIYLNIDKYSGTEIVYNWITFSKVSLKTHYQVAYDVIFLQFLLYP